MEQTKPQVPAGLIRPDFSERTARAASSPAGDWLCAWCLQPVANEKDRFQYEGRDEFTFTNPAGLHFDIITFSQAGGCRSAGVPTLKDTWFAAHAWSFCHCRGCGQHLGWFYQGQHDFVGLIKYRIVRAVLMRN